MKLDEMLPLLHARSTQQRAEILQIAGWICRASQSTGGLFPPRALNGNQHNSPPVTMLALPSRHTTATHQLHDR